MTPNNRIYLDNAATSFPKAPGIADEIRDFLERSCTNINRTSGASEYPIFEKIYSLRQNIARLVNLSTPESVCFSSGTTESLNLIIKGICKPGDHIIVSAAEHNSVMRPIVQLGLNFSRIPCNRQGYILLDHIAPLVRPTTKAILICAAGNVSGAIQDIPRLARLATTLRLPLFLDAAQALPHVQLDMDNWNLAGIIFSGHKGLLGPEATGGAALRKDIAAKITPLISGGTGSQSDSEGIPTTLPDRLEAGTQNIPGLLALAKSVEFVLKNKEELYAQEQRMTALLYTGLSEIPGIQLVGAPLDGPRTSVISITSSKKDIAEIASNLCDRYSVETRVGLHCSPSSHKTLGTFPTGTLRFSPGPFTTQEQIQTTLRAVKEILDE